MAIKRAVVFYTSVTIRRAVVLIQVYGLLHNIFMLFVDITVLINEIAIISPICWILSADSNHLFLSIEKAERLNARQLRSYYGVISVFLRRRSPLQKIIRTPFLYHSSFFSSVCHSGKISFLRHFSGVCRTISTFWRKISLHKSKQVELIKVGRK